VFLRIERRVRGLLHAAEAALRPIERRLADDTGNQALRILETADEMAPDAWPYSKVFRVLVAVGLGFLAAGVYAVRRQVLLTPIATPLFIVVLRAVSGVILLFFGFEMMASYRSTPKRPNQGRIYEVARLSPLMLGIAAAAAGIAVLFRLGFWGS
jgi:hypothetical protein